MSHIISVRTPIAIGIEYGKGEMKPNVYSSVSARAITTTNSLNQFLLSNIKDLSDC